MRLLHKEVFYDRFSPLYHETASEKMLSRDFDIKSGEWWYENGYIIGRNPGQFPGMIVSKKDYFGNVMIDFYAKIVSPSTHDINVMWNGSWDDEKNERGVAYVAGVNGWWRNMVGIEKSPDYKLNVGNPLFSAEADKEYHIQAGSVCGHCFVMIDGKEIVEITDPSPIDSEKYGKFGFEAYASMIAIREVSVYRLEWQESKMNYPREF
ncbi:MAG: hypothetical protein J5922_01115 [Clostridia bacterium]|nr:hypothetical protein [Clostridia bacterium]